MLLDVNHSIHKKLHSEKLSKYNFVKYPFISINEILDCNDLETIQALKLIFS